MPRYRADEHYPCFCTITTLDWVPDFIESRYIEPIVESLRFCRNHKGLELFAFVVMPNHVHLIVGCERDLHAVMRDLKRFAARTIHDRLKEDGRKAILEWLARGTERSRRDRGELGLWQDGFRPVAVHSPAVFEQKLQYLHDNPVRKGLVVGPQDWWYSSARNYIEMKEVCMEIDALGW